MSSWFVNEITKRPFVSIWALITFNEVAKFLFVYVPFEWKSLTNFSSLHAIAIRPNLSEKIEVIRVFEHAVKLRIIALFTTTRTVLFNVPI